MRPAAEEDEGMPHTEPQRPGTPDGSPPPELAADLDRTMALQALADRLACERRARTPLGTDEADPDMRADRHMRQTGTASS